MQLIPECIQSRAKEKHEPPRPQGGVQAYVPGYEKHTLPGPGATSCDHFWYAEWMTMTPCAVSIGLKVQGMASCPCRCRGGLLFCCFGAVDDVFLASKLTCHWRGEFLSFEGLWIYCTHVRIAECGSSILFFLAVWRLEPDFLHPESFTHRVVLRA